MRFSLQWKVSFNLCHSTLNEDSYQEITIWKKCHSRNTPSNLYRLKIYDNRAREFSGIFARVFTQRVSRKSDMKSSVKCVKLLLRNAQFSRDCATFSVKTSKQIFYCSTFHGTAEILYLPAVLESIQHCVQVLYDFFKNFTSNLNIIVSFICL